MDASRAVELAEAGRFSKTSKSILALDFGQCGRESEKENR